MAPERALSPPRVLSPRGRPVAESFASETFCHASFALAEEHPAHYYSVPNHSMAPAAPGWRSTLRLGLVCLTTLILAALTVYGSLVMLPSALGTKVRAPPALHHSLTPILREAPPPQATPSTAAPRWETSAEELAPRSAARPHLAHVAAAAITLDGQEVEVAIPTEPNTTPILLAALGVPVVTLMGNVFAHLEGPMGVDFVAGLIAAFCATSIMYPVDHMKTRLQLGRPSIPSGGLRQLYSGIAFAFAKDCPAAAVYITAFEAIKGGLLGVAGDHVTALGLFLLLALSGSLGDLCSSVFTLPMELMLKPIQAGQRTTFQDLFQKLGVSGILGCWRSVLLRDMPMGALQLAIFESLKTFAPMLDAEYHLPHFGTLMALGAIAGAASAFLTTPCDLLTSKLMTRGKEGRIADVLQEVWAKDGLTGLFRGGMLRTYYFAPECCIFFAVFETLTSLYRG